MNLQRLKPLRSGLSTIALGLLWVIGAVLFLCAGGNSPITEFLLLQKAIVVEGAIVETYEDVGDNGEGRAVFTYDLYYTYRTRNGRQMHGQCSHDGRLDAQLANLERPYPIQVEYVPGRPDLSRIKGSGCQTMGEWVWRKLGIGLPLLAMLVAPGFILCRMGLRELRNTRNES